MSDAPRAVSRPLPRPSALRLMRPDGARGNAPPAPFGLAGFDDAASSVAVELRPPEGEGGNALAEVAAQIPEARGVAAGAYIVVLGGARGRGLLGRLFRGADVPRAIRASALLARGYQAIGAGTDDATGLDLVWGSSPNDGPNDGETDSDA